ncbi:Lipocalin_family conserved site [Hexamita inflata]|uniref:Lipocalin family conserved site n=1 Tax=Hexamita inflata TaxID=28002 RepID=A0AA86Q012_9EUKA|nr:Lipocalin family conserved site [Hexamita inflata]
MFYSKTDRPNLLTVNWTHSESQYPFNLNLIKQYYPEIRINGIMNGHSLFQDYSVLSRTKTLYITNCILDLSKIEGDFDYINLINCECLNDFINCTSKSLNTYHSTLYVDQIHTLNVSNQVHITSSHIDYQHLHKLVYISIINLTILDNTVNLSLLSGNFTSVTFRQCKIIENSFNFKAKSICISNCQYSAESIESLDCETLSIFASGNKQLIQLPLKSKATRKTADLKGCTLDLSGVAGNWTELDCQDCVLEKSMHIDKYLQGNQKTQLRLKHCELSDLDQLAGKWYQICIYDSNFRALQVSDQNIVSSSVNVENVNIDDFSCFQTSHIRISKCTVRSVPENSVLEFNECNLSLAPNQINSNSIRIRNCVLNYFSVLNLPINSISFRGAQHHEHQLLYDSYIKSFNINKRMKWNMIKRVKQEQKRIQIKQIFVQNILNSTQCISAQVQQLNGGSE